jgi:hypothetical protein
MATLRVGTVAALYRPVALEAFRSNQGGGYKRKLSAKWLVPRVCRHEQVIEEVMRLSPVLPIRFGCVFASRQTLKTWVSDRIERIARFFADIADKEEWVVKGFIHPGKVLAWLLESSPMVSARRQSSWESTEVRSQQEPQLPAEVKQRVKPWIRAAVVGVRDELVDLASAFVQFGSLPAKLSARNPALVFNGAFLLRRSHVADFRSRMKTMEARHARQGLCLESSGPCPPFNFCPSFGLSRG